MAFSTLLVASSAFAAGAPSVTGQWSIHNNIAGSESDQVCKLVQTDNKISGSCKSEDKELPVKGSVDGNRVTWQYDSEYNGTPLTLTYTATVDDTDKITGAVDVAPFSVSGEFTATRSKGSEK
jgi:hypothetical protein